jgi:hypothetical protein
VLLPVLLVAALAAALAVAGPAAAKKKPAKTTVTITAVSDGFFGFVKSPKPGRCANNRTVTLYKQLGQGQHPATDLKYMTEVAELQGTRYRWDTGNSGNVTGRFYARAGRVAGCRPDNSPSVSQPPSD